MKKTCGAIIVLLCILLNTVIPISASEFSLHWAIRTVPLEVVFKYSEANSSYVICT